MGYLRPSSHTYISYLEKQAFFSKMWDKVKTNLGNIKDSVTNLATGKGSLRDIGSTLTGGAIAASKPDTNMAPVGGNGLAGKAFNATPLGMMTNLFRNTFS